VLDFRILLKVAYRSADMADLKFIMFTKDGKCLHSKSEHIPTVGLGNMFLKSYP